jgi:DNA-binding beta-propeller fold protein YncE
MFRLVCVAFVSLCASTPLAREEPHHPFAARQAFAAGPPTGERSGLPLPRFVREWGKKGAAHGEFGVPIGIAIDRHDRIFVTDMGNHRVLQFDTDGKFLADFAVPGAPGGIAVSPDGTLYVSLTMGGDRIVAFSPQGKLLRQWGKKGTGAGEFQYPAGLAVGPDGSLYVADNVNLRIQKFSPQGKFLARWGKGGDGPGNFGGKGAEKLSRPPFGTGPGWLAFDSKGLLQVSDSRAGKVHRFKPDGTFVSSWGTTDDGPGGFGSRPTTRATMAITIDSQKRVWVATNNRLQLFTAEGKYLTGFGVKGDGKGQFHRPHGLAIDSKGYLYVVDTRNHRIQKFAP